MKYIVIKSHVSNYPNPIFLEEGDVVKMIESYTDPENWITGCFVMKRSITEKVGFRSKL